MRSNDQNRRWAAGVGMAAGAAFAAALIGLANAPVAGADEGTAGDTAVDNFYQGIANFFAPEAAGNVFTADHFSDVFTGEGTAADQMLDAFYQQVSTAFQPEGQVDALFELNQGNGGLDAALDNQYQAIANFFAPEATGNMITADQFSDLFTGEGTAADQMLDGFYAAINTAFQPEGPIDVFFDQLFGLPF